MPVIFLETPRFPDNISYGSSGGPKFNTHIFESNPGGEQRQITWASSRAEYNISQGIRDKADVDVLIAFFYNMSGRASGFRFKDWADYEITDGNIGTGDGVVLVFKINKIYTIGANTYTRRTQKIVSGTAVVKVNGVTQTEGALNDYTINLNTGTVTFNAGSEPGVGLAVTITCEFDTPCRFDTDHMDVTHDGFITESWSSVPIVELLLDDV